MESTWYYCYRYTQYVLYYAGRVWRIVLAVTLVYMHTFTVKKMIMMNPPPLPAKRWDDDHNITFKNGSKIIKWSVGSSSKVVLYYMWVCTKRVLNGNELRTACIVETTNLDVIPSGLFILHYCNCTADCFRTFYS